FELSVRLLNSIITLSLLSFFFYRSRDLRDLLSFPTRRSSDLLRAAVLGLADDRGGWAEALVAQRGAGHADAVDVACRNATSTASDRKSTRLNSSHLVISYAVFCLKKKKKKKKR